MSRSLRPVSKVAVGAVFFGLVAFCFVAYLAYRGTDTKNPPDTREVIVLAAFSAVAQVVASYMWSQSGKAHPSHARSAVRRLGRAQLRTLRLSEAALVAYEEGTSNERRLQLGVLTSGLDSLAEDLEDAISDWREFHKRALEELENDEEEEVP